MPHSIMMRVTLGGKLLWTKKVNIILTLVFTVTRINVIRKAGNREYIFL